MKLIITLGSLVMMRGMCLDTSSSSRALRARDSSPRQGEPSFERAFSLPAVEPLMPVRPAVGQPGGRCKQVPG